MKKVKAGGGAGNREEIEEHFPAEKRSLGTSVLL